jgi:hypothetical protein
MTERNCFVLDVNGKLINILDGVLRPYTLRGDLSIEKILGPYNVPESDMPEVLKHIDDIKEELGGLDKIKHNFLEEISEQYFKDLVNNPLNSPS